MDKKLLTGDEPAMPVQSPDVDYRNYQCIDGG